MKMLFENVTQNITSLPRFCGSDDDEEDNDNYDDYLEYEYCRQPFTASAVMDSSCLLSVGLE